MRICSLLTTEHMWNKLMLSILITVITKHHFSKHFQNALPVLYASLCIFSYICVFHWSAVNYWEVKLLFETVICNLIAFVILVVVSYMLQLLYFSNNDALIKYLIFYVYIYGSECECR